VGKATESEPHYVVHIVVIDGCRLTSSFQGGRAAIESQDFFERCKQQGEVVELWVVRRRGGRWEPAIRPIRRDAGGEWRAAGKPRDGE
jgi:hypothetical protein